MTASTPRNAAHTAALLTLIAVALHAAPAAAQRAEVAAGGDNLDGATTAARLVLGGDQGHTFALEALGGAVRERFIGGYLVEDAALVEASAQAGWLLKQRGPARFRFAHGLGARGVLADAATPAGDTTWAVTTALTPTVEVDLRHDLTAIAQVELGVDLAVAPAVDLDLLESPMRLGARWWVADRWALTPMAWVGGATGYNGDGAKHRLGAHVGLAYAWDRAATGADADGGDPAQDDAGGVGAFVGLEWRALALAGHTSHGPAFSAGATFFGGRMKLGVLGFSRPGPLNTATFQVTAADGQTYKGQPTLDLRSDGTFVGVMVAGNLPLAPWCALEVPLTVGQAAFGFYLHGDDRRTPDGRRVSAWENELQDGRDASFTLGVDVGARLVFTPPAAPWLRPVVGVHYTATPGYDAFARDDYGGASVALGAELGVF